MNPPTEEGKEIQREFELERVILFSDAVFAIAITLLVLDLKYTDGDSANRPTSWIEIFKPLLLPFVSFVISFVFIGVQWSKHIEQMRFMKQYDKRFIMINLVFLFFIVLFPFSASFVGKAKPSQDSPYLLVYLSDILLCTISFYVLSYHVFKIKPSLCFEGMEAEKKISLRKNLLNVVTIAVLGVIVILMNFIPDSDTLRFALVLIAITGIRLLRKKILKGIPQHAN